MDIFLSSAISTSHQAKKPYSRMNFHELNINKNDSLIITMTNKSLQIRREAISKAKRILVKVGTRLLTDITRIPLLIDNIAKLREQGYEVILVSSGAVGIGINTLKMVKRPQHLSAIQALASVGQSKLISLYEKAAKKHGFHVAQLLLTKNGLEDREMHLNALNCINSLLELGILPIVNENDSVSVKELTFGDNDQLAVLLSAMAKCDITILLTTVNGLRNLDNGKLGERISVIKEMTPQIRSFAQGTDDSSFSVGGMKSKLKAADIALSAGTFLWIADGNDSSVLEKIFNSEDVGTIFAPSNEKQMPGRKRWLSFFSKVKGQLFIDAGAVNAIYKNGKSLLPAGIKKIEGTFTRGDAIELLDESGTLIAKGLCNYCTEDLRKISGAKTDKINKILGYQGDIEVIHRDNLVLNFSA